MINQKNIYTIAPQEDFLKTLATYIFNLKKGDMFALSQVKIILPNRRSMHKIKEYFVEIAPNNSLILPEILSLGGIDEDEMEISASLKNKIYQHIKPAIKNEKRLFLLAKLIKEKSGELEDISFEASLKLASSLASLLDDVEKHELTIENLKSIIPEELSRHRQISLDFIYFVFAEYPKMLEALGYIDNAKRTNQILKLFSEHLLENTPKAEIFIAGSTGSIPASRKLMKSVLSLPNGYVVLPYTDLAMNSFEWEEVGTDKNPISHQKHIRNLLKFLEVTRSDIKLLDSKTGDREAMISNIMRPATSIQSWKENKLSADKLNWANLIEAKNKIHESKIIGTIVRHKVGQGLRVALITNNTNLAEKVELYLTKFNIAADNSAGRTLDRTPQGNFLISAASLISEGFKISAVLGLLKNEHFNSIQQRELEEFEIKFVRKNNIKYLSEVFDKFNYDAKGALGKVLKDIYFIGKKLNAKTQDINELLKLTYEIINLSPKLNINESEAWQKIEDVLANFTSSGLQQIETNLFADCLKVILSGKKIWDKYKPARKVFILSSQEARLQHFDVAILADLTLGSWPSGKFSPWLNRRMYKEMELPFEEDSISLSAHDFSTHLFHKEVFITLSRYDSEEVAIESPFVTRLKTFYHAVTGAHIQQNKDYINYLSEQDEVAPKAYAPAYPTPPLEARFNKLSVTKIEKLLKNPYEIYASEILKLRKLDELEADEKPADYGNYVHKILDEFTKYHNLDASKITHQEFMNIAEKVHKEYEAKNLASPAWLSQISQISKWFVNLEQNDVLNIQKISSELQGQVNVNDFILTCKADRIELTHDKKINIIDYKTGQFPTQTEVERLISPQLLLEAFMLKQNAFEGLSAANYNFNNITYYNFSFSNKGPDKKPYSKINVSEKIDEVEVELKELIADIRDPKTPFLIRPNPDLQPKFDDYEHLERVEK